MILNIANRNEVYKIILDRYTQMCGLDFIKKDYILDSIIKYFSNSKYQEYEENMMNNIFLDNGEQLGRNYFNVIYINNRNDMLNLIKFSKSSIFQEYINNELMSYDYQIYIENIRDLLEKIYIDINNNLVSKLGNIKIDFQNEELLSIVHKSVINTINDKPIEECSNIELLNLIINNVKLLQEQTPNRILLIVKDIDHLISKKEYDMVYDDIIELVNKTNTYFLATISINNFAIMDINCIDAINVINDVIFQIDNFEKYKDFIINNYPINIDISDNELLKLTNMILQHIGSSNIRNDLRANIILKLLDASLAVDFDSKTQINNIEISFLNS